MKRIPASNRGSVLLVSLLIAAIIAIALTSYLQLANNSLKLSNRSFYANAAMNLAEIGLERALACLNELDNVATPELAWPSSPSTGFSGWALDPTDFDEDDSPFTPSARATFDGFIPGPGTTGSVEVYVHHYNGSGALQPTIVAKSTINQPDGPPITKYIEVTLRKRTLAPPGMVSRYNTTWNGTPMAGSWNSDPDNNPLTPAERLKPDYSNMTAEITVASLNGNIGLSGGEVWGYARTGPSGTITGGSVHGLGTTADDPSRRTNDFDATFPLQSSPNPSSVNVITSNITSNRTFPASGDSSVSITKNGVTTTTYYYRFNPVSSGPGAGSGARIDLAGSDHIQIAADKNVVFIMENHSGASAVSFSGNATFTVNTGASLHVYTNGNIAIAGNGFVNDNAAPSNCWFWGTNSGANSQTIDISGNGTLSAVVYAPNAAVTLNGGGSAPSNFLGAIVGETIRLNGQTKAFYDEALSNLTVGNPYGISKWKELQSASERAEYSSVL